MNLIRIIGTNNLLKGTKLSRLWNYMNSIRITGTKNLVTVEQNHEFDQNNWN
jgi:hypothetical protein